MKLDLASFELSWSWLCGGPPPAAVGAYTCTRGIEVMLHMAHSGRAAVYLVRVRPRVGAGVGAGVGVRDRTRGRVRVRAVYLRGIQG